MTYLENIQSKSTKIAPETHFLAKILQIILRYYKGHDFLEKQCSNFLKRKDLSLQWECMTLALSHQILSTSIPRDLQNELTLNKCHIFFFTSVKNYRLGSVSHVITSSNESFHFA